MTATQLDLFATETDQAEKRRRLLLHARGDFCPACGTADYPHGLAMERRRA